MADESTRTDDVGTTTDSTSTLSTTQASSQSTAPEVDDAAADTAENAAADTAEDVNDDTDVLELSIESKKDVPPTDFQDKGSWEVSQSSSGLEVQLEDAHEDHQELVEQTDTKPTKVSAPSDKPIVVDATNHVAGRLSSHVAKLLLNGNRVALVNCERIMISGSRANTIHEYRQFLKINSIINPKHGPVHYRRPDTVITKMIRGMLPFGKKPTGRQAHKRLRAYIGSPKDLRSFKKVQFEKAKIKRSASTYTTMGELCRVIGWTE